MRSILLVVVAVSLLACGGGGGSADAPPAATDTAPVGDTWTSFASGFTTTYCAECHGAGDPLRDFSVLAMVRAEAATIRCGVSAVELDGCSVPARQFPIGDGPLPSDVERTRFVEWLDAGAPE